MSVPAEQWAGSFGAGYTARNRVDWRARVPFWRDILDRTGARSVYEVGTNSGWNLSAIRRARPDVQTSGCEVNKQAMIQARHAGHEITWLPAPQALETYEGGTFDLIVTAGVLIHIPPAQLHSTMQAIVDASADYVLAVEYHAEQEEEVEYRGHAGMLWRRPYGKLYQAMGLVLVDEWDAGEGFDRCRAVLLRKRIDP